MHDGLLMTSWRLVLRSQVPIYLTVPRREALPKLTPQQIGFAVLEFTMPPAAV
jgi:hypothetical protein